MQPVVIVFLNRQRVCRFTRSIEFYPPKRYQGIIPRQPLPPPSSANDTSPIDCRFTIVDLLKILFLHLQSIIPCRLQVGTTISLQEFCVIVAHLLIGDVESVLAHFRLSRLSDIIRQRTAFCRTAVDVETHIVADFKP
jgi:hypothetical protein